MGTNQTLNIEINLEMLTENVYSWIINSIRLLLKHIGKRTQFTMWK